MWLHEGGVAAAATAIVTENLDELAPFASGSLGPIQFDLVATAMRRLWPRGTSCCERERPGGFEKGMATSVSGMSVSAGGVVQIFDCVEFNRDLRCADVASDLAFLLMDLTRLGASGGRGAPRRYREAGMDLPDELLRYSAHRALVRAKIAGLELPGSGRKRQRHMAEATDYLDLASAAASLCGQSSWS